MHIDIFNSNLQLSYCTSHLYKNASGIKIFCTFWAYVQLLFFPECCNSLKWNVIQQTVNKQKFYLLDYVTRRPEKLECLGEWRVAEKCVSGTLHSFITESLYFVNLSISKQNVIIITREYYNVYGRVVTIYVHVVVNTHHAKCLKLTVSVLCQL